MPFSTNEATITRLEQLDGPGGDVRQRFEAFSVAPNVPLVRARTKAFVIGHPLGSGLQISLHDSLLLDIDDDKRLIHYRTPTDPGSSGSPVFNANWQVIGLHHAGSSTAPRLHGTGTYEANEAISLLAIRRWLNAYAASSAAPRLPPFAGGSHCRAHDLGSSNRR